jgi:hypothetical protein
MQKMRIFLFPWISSGILFNPPAAIQIITRTIIKNVSIHTDNGRKKPVAERAAR